MKKKTKKQFHLEWAFEPFLDDPSFFTKKMFGCLAAYIHEKISLVLAEDPGEKTWKKKKYPFDIWNGVLIPTEREHHPSLLKTFPELVPHPVLPKWLYLHMDVADFEETVTQIGRLIAKNDQRFGVISKLKR